MQDTPRRILIVAAVFAAANGDDPWLIDDLAAEFTRQGHQVDVIVHDVKRPRPCGPQPSDRRMRVYSVGPQRVHHGLFRLASYAVAGLRLNMSGWRLVSQQQYDHCFYFSPAVLSGGFPSRVRAAGVAKNLTLVYWDFFPEHHIEIGRIPRFLRRPLRTLEFAAMRRADHIAVMTPKNAEYLQRLHPQFQGHTIIVPPWGGHTTRTAPPSEKFEDFTVVFGGQLTFGRGVDVLIDAARILSCSTANTRFIIAGSGADAESLQNRSTGLTSVTFTGQLHRSEYLALISRAHVGVAATVPGVSVPTFPSKVVDYFRAGIPVIASLEETTDAGALISASGAGVSVKAGDPHVLARAIDTLRREHESGRLALRTQAARAYYLDELASQTAARRLLATRP